MFFFSLLKYMPMDLSFQSFIISSIPGTFFIYNINNAQGKKKISDCSFVNYFLTPLPLLQTLLSKINTWARVRITEDEA